MHNNSQQLPVYTPTGSYVQPTYSTQQSQPTYTSQQSQPIYSTQQSQPTYSAQHAQPTYPTQQAQLTYSAQHAQPTYFPQQTQMLYGNNPSMNQQIRPIYESTPNQPSPPPYATAVQSTPNPTYRQQQPSYNPRPQGTPFSSDYKWPHRPIAIVCPKCGASVTTLVETRVTSITCITAFILLLFTCILACLPFFIPACKRITHYCPYCKSMLGVRREFH